MDKKLYDLLNDMDINLDRYEKEELSEFEKSKYKKDINNRISKEKVKAKGWKKGILVVVASLLILFGFSRTDLGKDTYAIASEVFTNIKYGIREGLGFIDDIDQYSSKIDLVSESEGIKIKLTELIVDRDKIYFTLLADIKEHIPEEYLEDEEIAFLISLGKMGSYKSYDKVTMNDKEVKINSSKTTIGGSHSKLTDKGRIEGINNKESRDKGIFDIVVIADNPLEYDVGELEDIDFKFIFNYLEIYMYKPYSTEYGKKEPTLPDNIDGFYGDWEFKFTKSGKELSIDTDKFMLGESILLDGLNLEFIELTSNSLGNKIEAKIKNTGLYEEELGTTILFDGHDNLGQRRSFSFILEEGENKILINEHYNLIDYPQDMGLSGSHFKDVNIDFKGVEYIEFTPYCKKVERGYRKSAGDPIKGFEKLGEPFKLYLNKQ